MHTHVFRRVCRSLFKQVRVSPSSPRFATAAAIPSTAHLRALWLNKITCPEDYFTLERARDRGRKGGL